MSVEFSDVRLQGAILIDFAPNKTAPPGLLDSLFVLASETGAPAHGVKVFQALADPRVTAYLYGAPQDDIAATSALTRERLRPFANGDIEISRLATEKAFAGASHDQEPTHHYVVRTDVEPGGEAELVRWYDEEHMPGLARVPGTVVARRLISLDAPPRYYALYDLISPEPLESPQWLAVRGTAWSDRVRPTFRNTRRIMYRRLMGPRT